MLLLNGYFVSSNKLYIILNNNIHKYHGSITSLKFKGNFTENIINNIHDLHQLSLKATQNDNKDDNDNSESDIYEYYPKNNYIAHDENSGDEDNDS